GGDRGDSAGAVDRRGRLGALWRKATDPRRTGNRVKGYPNTDQSPVARLVGRYAVTLIGRIHRARPDHIWATPAAVAAGNCGFDDTSHKHSYHSNTPRHPKHISQLLP